MNLLISKDTSKQSVFDKITQQLEKQGFTIINSETRPWGGFFVIDENQAEKFIEEYFVSEKQQINIENKLSPKFLIVEPGKRLSWQYHHRRSEIWKVIGGKVGVVKSDTDEETDMNLFNTGDVINLKEGERHRLIGLETWGIVAEIWQHTNEDLPSNEDDIVRLSDDFGR